MRWIWSALFLGREAYHRASAQEKNLKAVTFSLRTTARRLQEVEEALEVERAHPQLHAELEEEKGRRLEAEAIVHQIKLHEEELEAAKAFAERQQDLAEAGRLEADATRFATEEARSTAKAAWGAVDEVRSAAETSLKAAKASRDVASAELVFQRVALDMFKMEAEEWESNLKAKMEEWESHLKEEMERLKLEHAAALSQARKERFEVLDREEDVGLELEMAYFSQSFDYCKEKVTQKFPDIDLGDIRPGGNDL